MNGIPQYVEEILKTLEQAGYEAWCVGGCVRDLLLERTPQDWDVTTSARPEETMAVFDGRSLPTGLRHGTVTVRQGTERVEVTTFRLDGVYRDHRRPETVAFTDSLVEDLRRRDFTVNAMAMDRRGNIRDPFGGREDLQNGVLRCVGAPEARLREDALRILRGLRFSACLGLSPETETAAALHRCGILLADIAPERIWGELSRLLEGDWAPQVLREFPDVLAVFWPEISAMVGFDQHSRHHCYDVWEHTLHALSVLPPDRLLRCTMLLHDVGKPGCFVQDASGSGHFPGHPERGAVMAEKMLRRLRVDNRTTETVVCLVRWHDRNIPRTRPGIRRALAELGEENLRRLLEIKRADNLAQASQDLLGEIRRAEEILDGLAAEGACVSLRQLAVRGNDLAALGLKGAGVGQMLRLLLNAVLDEAVANERTALMQYARKSMEETR
ncbi:CCA tRNA nucleotidyltransferase [uncultured Oscillibacter sp.]|uniref:CCA tRNA nucleotidyltransferase n=1 Tax=uncultured Oscillibacter sp. TaxID=876091 RepID=UPI0025D9FEE7|nr:HD domain-containing protein [uncultured Oscillibacter sp.]